MKLSKIVSILLILCFTIVALFQVFYPNAFQERFYWSKDLIHKDLTQKQTFDLTIENNPKRDFQSSISFIFLKKDKQKIEYFKQTYKGIPTAYNITITDKKTNKIIVNEQIVNPRRTSFGYVGDYKRKNDFNLNTFSLEKGNYEISIQCIKDEEQLKDIAIKFEIYYIYCGK